MLRLGNNSSPVRTTGRWRLAASLSVVLGATVLAVPAASGAPPAPAAPAAVSVAEPTQVRLAPAGDGLRAAEVPLAGARRHRAFAQGGIAHEGPVALRTERFTMVAAHWQGDRDPGLQVRLHDGRTPGEWQRLDELHDGPDAGAAEANGRHGTNVLWVGPSSELEVRSTSGAPTGVSLVLLDTTGVQAAPSAARAQQAQKAKKPRSAPRPWIRKRKVWGANEKWRTSGPVRNKWIRQVHVHHTVNSNSYERGDVAGIIKGIYRYHTKSLGWSDLGYNVLIDRFGRAWAGRAGGIGKRVRGAHTLGFNHASSGIAVIGNYEEAEPDIKVLRRIAGVSAWLLDKDGSKARGKVRVKSKGSDLYRKGQKVKLPIIDGHRDTNQTACPGANLYDRLPKIRKIAQRRVDRF